MIDFIDIIVLSIKIMVHSRHDCKNTQNDYKFYTAENATW